MPESRPAESSPEVFLEELADGEDGRRLVILASSRRLWRFLVNAHNERMVSLGKAAWTTPPIHFWQDWLTDLAEASATGSRRRVLPPAAALAAWEQAMAGHLPEGISSPSGIARQANATARLLGEWRLGVEEVRAAARSPDELFFARSLESYHQRLEAMSWSEPGAVVAEIVDALGSGQVTLPETVVVLGFDRLSPLVAGMVRNLETAGVRVVRPGPAAPAVAPAVHAYPDEESELRAAGAWARKRLDAEPGGRFAIVVSELERDTERVGRLIREGFAPGWQVAGNAYEASVEVSYGRKLADYPLVATALSCLRWAAFGLDSAAVSVLLRSSSLRGAGHAESAGLELLLRDYPDRTWSPASLADALAQPEQPESVRSCLDGVRNLARIRGRLSGRRPPSQWARGIDDLLGAVGWPGAASLASDEFQVVNRWREVLNELAGLDGVLGNIGLEQAIRRMSLMTAETLFQPEGDGGRLQVIGPLEAAGMVFDGLWVARTDADRWPAAGHPSPLVSRALQASHRMPDSSPADTLDYARRVLSRLAGSAPELRFSWSRADLDAVRLPSPLLSELGCRESEGPRDPDWFAASLAAGDRLTIAESDPVPPMKRDEPLAGGVRTVQLQRSEPFSAFAAGRLAIRDIEPFAKGLGPRLRGTLVHAALEQLYFPGLAQAELAGWTPENRQNRIRSAVDRSLSPAERHADAVLRRLLAIERQRMIRVLDDVISADLARSSFTVDAVEERLEFRHAGIRLDLRADRIDRLDDGSLLIVDYKTGRPKPLIRNDGEPADLQLPIYATAVDRPVGGLGLLFARPRDISWKLVGPSIDVKPTDADDWTRTLRHWSDTIASLIDGIVRGDVRVNVRGDADRSWQLNVLCRSAEEKRAD